MALAGVVKREVGGVHAYQSVHVWMPIALALADVTQEATALERERAAKVADEMTKPSAVKLAAGEMTAQEMRSVVAIAKRIAAVIRRGD